MKYLVTWEGISEGGPGGHGQGYPETKMFIAEGPLRAMEVAQEECDNDPVIYPLSTVLTTEALRNEIENRLEGWSYDES